MKLKLFNFLEDKRILIRPFKSKDSFGLYQLMSDKKSMEFSVLPQNEINEIFCIHYINSLLELYSGDDPIPSFAVILKESDEFIGTIGLMPYEEDFEVYYILKSDFWNRGLGKETLNLFVHYYITKVKNKKIYAFVFSENVKSIHFLEKLNWTFIKKTNHPIYHKAGFLFENINHTR